MQHDICERGRQGSFSEGGKLPCGERSVCVYVTVCVYSMCGKTIRFWPSWEAESSRAKCPDSREVRRPSHAVSRNRIGCWDELLLPEWPSVSSLAACWSYLLDCVCVRACDFRTFPLRSKGEYKKSNFHSGWLDSELFHRIIYLKCNMIYS